MSPSSPRSTGAANKVKVEDLTYEAAFAELETIVTALEDEAHPLEESLSLYERGQILAAHCAALLDKAELKIRQLGADGLAEYAGEA